MWPKIDIFGHFGSNIGFSDSFGAMPFQRNNANEVLSQCSDMWIPELLLPPKMIWMFGPKTAFLFCLHTFCHQSYHTYNTSNNCYREEKEKAEKLSKIAAGDDATSLFSKK